MTLTEALVLVFNDSLRCTRRAWASPAVFVSIVEGRLCISGFSDKNDNDPRPHPLIVTEQDYFADDWEVVE